MHKLLARQLKKAFGNEQPSPELESFVAAIDAAYEQADRDRALLERSMELASRELLERNRQLQKDIETRKRLELELQQSTKLKAVGQLAAGIAHEINTPIQYIGDNVSFLKVAFAELQTFIEQALAQTVLDPELLHKRDELEFLCEQIPGAVEASADGCRRVAEIVRAMKVFAHPGGETRTTADINQALSSTLAVARNAVKYVAQVELELGDLPLVTCRIGDVNQVFLNLIVNAAHAVADRFNGDAEQGRIRVCSRTDGKRVIVEVVDNGNGIPPEVQARIFEPFFTTKAVGRGTGQGLAISRAIIVEQHGGELSFETKPGEGTKFTIELPVSEDGLPAPAIVGERSESRTPREGSSPN